MRVSAVMRRYPCLMAGMQLPAPAPKSRLITARYAIPGFLGTSLLALGALGVGWLPPRSTLWTDAIIGALRSTTAGAFLARGAIFLGVALVLQAWLVLGHDVLDNVERSTRRLVMILSLWCAPLVLAPPLFSRDAFSYYAQGQLMIAGLNPYTTGVSSLPGWFQWGADPLWSESPTPYGPAFLLAEHAVATLAGSRAMLGTIIFRIMALTGVALLAVFLPRLAHAHGIEPAKALWLAVLNPLVLMHFVAGAHNDALMVGLMVAGLTLAIERHPILGVAAIGLAGAVKPIALLVLPFAGLIWAGVTASWPARIYAWVKCVAVVALIFVVLSWFAGYGLGWITSLGTPGSVRTWLSPPTAVGMILGGLARLVGLAGLADGALSLARNISMVAGAFIGIFLVVRPQGRSAVRGAGLALLAVVVLGPVLQPWYLLWVLPLLAATGFTGTMLRVAMLLTALLAVHGMTESNATADTLFDIRDGLASLAAIGVVVLVLLSSPGERRLVFGDPVDRGIRPDDQPARERAGAQVMR